MVLTLDGKQVLTLSRISWAMRSLGFTKKSLNTASDTLSCLAELNKKDHGYRSQYSSWVVGGK